MNMVVCVKQVIDPEAPPATFKIDPSTGKPHDGNYNEKNNLCPIKGSNFQTKISQSR